MNNLKKLENFITEKVAMQGLGFAVNLETMGGVSVKKDGGAASALDTKIDESSFVHITDGITSASLMVASPNPGFKFVEGPDGNKG